MKYDVDGSEEDFELEEIRGLLIITDHPLRKDVLGCVQPAFTYLENRLIGSNVASCYDYRCGRLACLDLACRSLSLVLVSFSFSSA